MKKVLSIVIAVALVLSCCVVAFAETTTNLTGAEVKTRVEAIVGEEALKRVMLSLGFDLDNPMVLAGLSAKNLTDEEIAAVLVGCLNDEGNIMDYDQAEQCATDFKNDFGDHNLTEDQYNYVHGKLVLWKATHQPAGGDSGSGDSGDSGSGSGLPFDIDLSNLGNITDIFSNLGGNIDLSKFLEGAKSGIGQLFDGLKGAGLPDISGLTGLLGSIPGLDMIMGLFGGGGDDGGNGGGNGGTTPSPYTPSTNPSGGNSNSQVIPKTADTAPIAAVATLAVVAGVAFVLTRKKNED